MLDLDGNGALDHDEIIGVIQKRGSISTGNQDDVKDIASNGVRIFFTQLEKLYKFIRETTGL